MSGGYDGDRKGSSGERRGGDGSGSGCVIGQNSHDETIHRFKIMMNNQFRDRVALVGFLDFNVIVTTAVTDVVS